MFTKTDLRGVMQRWPSGVAILTARDGEHVYGMTVGSFTSVSIDPPLVTVTLANKTRSKGLVERSGAFAINLLTEDQQQLADVFAGRIQEHEDRFEGVEVTPGLNQVPLIARAAAHLECRVVHAYAMENSTLFVAEVLNAEKAQDAQPLVYFNRAYHRITK